MWKRTVATDKNNKKGECACVFFHTHPVCGHWVFTGSLGLSAPFFSLVLLSEPNTLLKPSCKAGPESLGKQMHVLISCEDCPFMARPDWKGCISVVTAFLFPLYLSPPTCHRITCHRITCRRIYMSGFCMKPIFSSKLSKSHSTRKLRDEVGMELTWHSFSYISVRKVFCSSVFDWALPCCGESTIGCPRFLQDTGVHVCSFWGPSGKLRLRGHLERTCPLVLTSQVTAGLVEAGDKLHWKQLTSPLSLISVHDAVQKAALLPLVPGQVLWHGKNPGKCALLMELLPKS